MISLHLEAETPLALYQQMAQLMVGAAALMSGAAPGIPAIEPEQPETEEKPTRKARAKKGEAPGEPDAQSDTKASSDEASATEDGTKTGSTGQTATTDASPSELTPASLRARAMAFSQKAGPTALIEMQKLAGAPNGKMSEIGGDEAKGLEPDVERMTKLDALLADAGY